MELAPWAITQLRLGGVAFFPQTVGKLDGPGLLPNRNLVLWPYTRLADPRLSLNDDLHLIHANPDPHAVKIGYLNRAGWAAYLSGGVLFVKRWKAAARRPARQTSAATARATATTSSSRWRPSGRSAGWSRASR